VVQIGDAAILSNREYDEDEVDEVSDPNFFVVDDNHRFWGGEPFMPCDQYYYFVAARDLLGRDGLLSTGTLVTICDRLPPHQVREVSVRNEYVYESVTDTGIQYLAVSWMPHDNQNDDPKGISNYHIYRWTNSSEYLEHPLDESYGRIAIVAHTNVLVPHLYNGIEYTNLLTLEYRDTNGPAVPEDAGRTFWYTVRAEDDQACGTCTANLSGHSAPAYGILRDRVGPERPTGRILIRSGEPVVEFLDVSNSLLEQTSVLTPIPNLVDDVVAIDDCPDAELTITQDPPAGTEVPPGVHPILLTVADESGNEAFCETTLETGFPLDWDAHFRFSCIRTNRGITSVEFYLDDPNDPENLLARLAFPNDKDIVSLEHTVSRDHPVPFTVYCRAIGLLGETVDAFYINRVLPGSGVLRHIRFSASLKMTTTDLNFGVHFLPDIGTDMITPVGIEIDLTDTTREWKLYRRVDDEELTLIDQGTNSFVPSDFNIVYTTDDALPPVAASICYYAQLFDEHGNASPLSRLGCIETSTELPTPQLLPIEPDGTESNNPSMTLQWFCEPEGVASFRVWIAEPDEGLPDHLTSALSTNKAAPTNLLSVAGNRASPLNFDVFQTPMLGGQTFGSMPIFETTVPVNIGKTYTVLIQAVDQNNRVENFSNLEEFNWALSAVGTGTSGPDVPWPARPLPAVTDAGFRDRVVAKQLIFGEFRGVGIRIGDFDFECLTCRDGTDQAPFFTPDLRSPTNYLYRSTINRQSILPFVIYRYQVPNTLYDKVSGDVVQVSPLIEDIAYTPATNLTCNYLGSDIKDPFIAVLSVDRYEWTSLCSGLIPSVIGNFEYTDCSEPIVITQSPAAGTPAVGGWHAVEITATDAVGNTSTYSTEAFVTISSDSVGPVTYEILALDTQPVIEGARYRYLLVHFNEDFEIDRVISVGEIEVSTP